MDVVAALLLVGLGQGLLLAGLLLVRRDLRGPSTLCLAGAILAATLSGLEDAALRLGWLDAAPGLSGATLPLLPFAGPLLRGHVAAALDRDWRPARLRWGWAVATAIGLAAALAFLGHDGATRLAVLADRADPPPGAVGAALALLVAHGASAGALGAALLGGLREVRRRGGALAPDAPLASRLLWLRGLLALAAVAWLGYAASLVAGLAPGLPAEAMQTAAGAAQVASLYALGLLGLARPDRMLPPPGEMLAAVLAPRAEKYGRSALGADERARIAAAIERAMAQDGLYRDPLLSLQRLAAAVGASPNDVSQTINAAFGVGYHDYVARWRVGAAKARLADPDCVETLLEVLLDAGFNSKSAFNAAFKRETGLTPSAFRAASRAAEAGTGGET